MLKVFSDMYMKKVVNNHKGQMLVDEFVYSAKVKLRIIINVHSQLPLQKYFICHLRKHLSLQLFLKSCFLKVKTQRKIFIEIVNFVVKSGYLKPLKFVETAPGISRMNSVSKTVATVYD